MAFTRIQKIFSKFSNNNLSGLRVFTTSHLSYSESDISRPTDSRLPDYGKTTVNIHDHRLKRPNQPPPPAIARRWQGLRDLKDRTKGSLIPETLAEMSANEDFMMTADNLRRLGQKQMTLEEWKRRQKSLEKLGTGSFMKYTRQQRAIYDVDYTAKFLFKREISVMQLNIGLYCNQACNHCHVESSPKRKEMMSREVVDKCLGILQKSPNIQTVDITGGAPELCDEFRYAIGEVRSLGRHIIDRCNLTSLLEPGQEDTAHFLAENKVHLIVSLPCYSSKNVNLQRGSGVFDKSIQALILLNSLGYGKANSGLKLDVMYNPLGGFLPPPQSELEDKYKKELWEVFGVEFNNLFTATNMPIKRFFDFLYKRNELDDYMELLIRNFNVETVDKAMCMSYMSVSWDGTVYDCDYNQQLDLPILHVKQQSEKGVLYKSVEMENPKFILNRTLREVGWTIPPEMTKLD